MNENKFTLSPAQRSRIRRTDEVLDHPDDLQQWTDAHGVTGVVAIYYEDQRRRTFIERESNVEGVTFFYEVIYHHPDGDLAPYQTFTHKVYGRNLRFDDGVSITYASIDEVRQTICRVTFEHRRGYLGRNNSDVKYLPRFQFLHVSEARPRVEWNTEELGKKTWNVDIDTVSETVRQKFFVAEARPSDLFDLLDEWHSKYQVLKGVD